MSIMVKTIPEGWKIITLENTEIEIIDGDRGKNYPKKSELLQQGYCPFFNNKNIIGDKISLEEVEFISEEKDSKLRKGKAFLDDIIITTRGSVGNVGIMHEGLGITFARINSGMVILQNKDSDINTWYLYYLLKSPLVKEQYRILSSGSAQPQLPIRDLKKVELVLPPYDLQEKIASILSSYERKIELNNQMNQTLEEMAMTLYKHWFLDFGPFQDGEFVESELGMIPKGWEVKPFGDLFNLIRDSWKPNKPGNLLNYIGLEHMPRGSIALTEWGDSITVTSNKYKFRKGDILFGKLRPYFKKVGIAPFDGICSTDIIVLRPKKSDLFGILLGVVIRQEFINYCTGSSSGTRMPRANWSEIKKYKVVIPKNYSLVKQFTNKIQTISEMILNNIYELNTLEEVREYLLPKLLSGGIDLSETEKEVEKVI